MKPIPASGLPVITFRRGAQRFGFALPYVHEVQPLEQIAPVPGTPPFVVGIANLRGQLLSVLDPAPLLGLSAPPPGEGARILVVTGAGLQVGLVADQVESITTLLPGQVEPPLPTQNAIPREVNLGLMQPDLGVLLDLEAILSAPGIVVDHEPD